jgi:hypothetical protein
VTIGHSRAWPPAFWLDLVAKVALAATLVAMLAAPGLREFSVRGVAGRVVAAIVALVAVPAWWASWGRRRSGHGYPFVLDAVLALPFLIELWARPTGFPELAGGTQVRHAVDFVLLATALALVLVRLELSPASTAALVLAGGAAAAVLWELLEDWTFASHGRLWNEDSIADVALALGAAAAVAAATGLVLARTDRAPSGT